MQFFRESIIFNVKNSFTLLLCRIVISLHFSIFPVSKETTNYSLNKVTGLQVLPQPVIVLQPEMYDIYVYTRKSKAKQSKTTPLVIF